MVPAVTNLSHRAQHVGIVGLGTAGAAAAIFLARQGHRVTLFEKTPGSKLRGAAAGAGICLQPIGMRVLERLGILDGVLRRGRRIERLRSVTERGRTVLDLSYSDFRPGVFGLGLHRDVLFRELHGAVLAEPNVNILYGREVDRLEAAFPEEGWGGGGGREQQNRVVGSDGSSEGPFDLLVVADGRTSVRAATSARAVERWYPFGCLWTILPDRRGVFTSSPTLSQVLSAGSAEEMLGFLPSGRTHDMEEDDPGLVSLFWSLDMASLGAVRDAGLDAWKGRVLELQPAAGPLLDEIGTFEQLIPARYSDTFMPAYYHGKSTVFLGDCAHATSPQLGQGANLALVDAWQLSESMKMAATASGGLDPSQVVRHYDKARRWRLRFYQLNSKMLTPVFQSHSRVIGCLRDALMGHLCCFPPTRWQMLTTLVGAQNNGIPWKTIPEDEFILERC